MYKEIINKIIENAKEEDMYKISELTEEAMEHLKECNNKKYKEIMCELKEIAYGKVITEDTAHEWVVNMKPHGEHWNKETTDGVIEDKELDVDSIAFYVVMNMMYNDFERVIEDDLETYIKLSICWLNDEDTKKDKLYEYKKHIVEE